MFKGRKVFSFVLLLVLVSACNLPAGPAAVGGAGSDPVSGVEASDLGPMAVSDTPGPTLTASLPPSPTVTSPPPNPLIRVSTDTNCRKGPGQVYDYLGGLLVGETGEVLARDPTGKYWYIRNLDGPGSCWVWGEYATIAGDTSFLPVYTPEPTPTPIPTPLPTPTPTTLPAAAFSVSYVGLSHCGASYLLKFKISNTGGVTWESITISANDLTLNTSVPVTRDGFPIDNGCTSSANPDLTPGEVVVTASGGLPSNPTGHSFMAYVKICSQDGLTGTCLSKTINFTP